MWAANAFGKPTVRKVKQTIEPRRQDADVSKAYASALWKATQGSAPAYWRNYRIPRSTGIWRFGPVGTTGSAVILAARQPERNWSSSTASPRCSPKRRAAEESSLSIVHGPGGVPDVAVRHAASQSWCAPAARLAQENRELAREGRPLQTIAIS
jgi:hypothetical protein